MPPHDDETDSGEVSVEPDSRYAYRDDPFAGTSAGDRAAPRRAGGSTDQHIVVVERRSDLKWAEGAHRIITAKDYIANAETFKPNTRVINLSRSHAYLGYGFYSSLLAEARRHRVIPTVRTMLDLSRKSAYRFALTELDALLRKRIKKIVDPPIGAFSLRLFFGDVEDRRFSALARRVFDLFRCPLLDLQIRMKDGDWRIHAIRPVSVDALRPDQERRFAAALAAYTRATWRTPKEKAAPQKTIAILHNPKEAMPPSDAKALQRFVKVGESLGVAVEFITKRDFESLAEYDALFIRETTAIDDHTYRFAKRAEREGIPVIDDPTSILRCFNKVFLAELLAANKVPTPLTVVVDARNLLSVEQQISYPIVLKIPDGSFSRGVLKVSDRAELVRTAEKLFAESDVILAQEFMYTEFDWRVGVLNRQPIFACKYRMARHHWQVIKHVGNGTVRMGSAETIPVDQAPAAVIATAVKAAGLIGDGLYGVDLKETPRGVFVIEVNDNPNIEHGCEDNVLKDELYRMILKELLRRMDEVPGSARPAPQERHAPPLRVISPASASAE